MNLPNKLTITRIILVPILILIYMFPYATFGINVPMYHILNADISLVNIVIFIIFAVASLTDYFDGQIARKSKLITTFGKFADPIADKLLINTIFLLLASDGTISIIIPIIMISRDTIVDAIRLVAANKQVVIAAKYLGKLKTVTQMIAIILAFLDVNAFGACFKGNLTGFALILNAIVTIMMIIQTLIGQTLLYWEQERTGWMRCYVRE